MAFRIEQLFAPTAVPAAPAAIYTSPLNERAELVTLICVNFHTDPHDLTLWLVAPGAAQSNANLILPAFTILAGEARPIANLNGVVIPEGYSLWADTDAADRLRLFATGLKMP